MLLRRRFDAGVGALDEAMAAVTGGEVGDPSSSATYCCVVTLACESHRELERLCNGTRSIDLHGSGTINHGPLLAFCGAAGGVLPGEG